MVDAPALAGAFGRELHRAGIPVTPERSARFAVALHVAPPGGRSRLYWTARTVFVSARDQIAVFDGLFAVVFDGLLDPAGAVRGDQNAPPLGERSPSPGVRLPPGPEEREARSSISRRGIRAWRPRSIGSSMALTVTRL